MEPSVADQGMHAPGSSLKLVFDIIIAQNHTRLMPFLIPPPEFKPGELSAMGLTGTCELQICRSAGPWSLGTPEKTESSIQNAYLKGRFRFSPWLVSEV